MVAGWIGAIENCPPSITAAIFTRVPGIGFSHIRRLGRGLIPSSDVSVASPLCSLVFCM